MVLRLINEGKGSGGRARWMAGLARKIGLSDCFGKDEKDPEGTRCWGRMLVKKFEHPFVLSEVLRKRLRKLGCTSHEPEACIQEEVRTLVFHVRFYSQAMSWRTWIENLKMWLRCSTRWCSVEERWLRSRRSHSPRGQWHPFHGFLNAF